MLSPQQLLANAQPFKDNMIAFLKDLIRIRSVNGINPEHIMAERIAEEAKSLNLEVKFASVQLTRPNVLVTWGRGENGFLLVGHMDTVPEGDQSSWTHSPFGAQIENGRIFGRGAADNKAGLACGLYAIALIRDLGLIDPEKTKVILAGVVDEESGASSKLGVRYLLDHGFLSAKGAIYTYASDIVCVGHRGLLRFELTAHGQSIHTGSPAWAYGQGGVNAVTGLASILLDLEEVKVTAPENHAFLGMGCTITPGTIINGGEWGGMVPAKAKALVDVRLMPGQSVEEVVSAVNKIIDKRKKDRPGLNVDLLVTINLPGATIPIDHPLVTLTQRYAREITGYEWIAAGAGPANEGYMLIGAGIPTLCGFGPTGDGAHAADEWIELASLTRTVAMYAGIIQEYLK